MQQAKSNDETPPERRVLSSTAETLPDLAIDTPIPSVDTTDTLADPESEQEAPIERPAWPPAPRKIRRRSRFSRASTVLLVILALLLIVSGLGFIVYDTTLQYRHSLHILVTGEARATSDVLSTAQAYKQGTANALSTIQAGIDASATAQSNTDATATATIDNATATATTLNDLYTKSTSGQPVFDDPLSDNTGVGKWSETNPPNINTGCSFSNGNYQVSEAQQGFLQPCVAEASRFSNFTYQVHVTITQGNQAQAGLLFDVNPTNNAYYFFRVSTDSSYALDSYQSNGQVTTLTKGINPIINTGLNQSNQLTVIVSSSTFDLYANGQYITSVTDSALGAGKIGVAVINGNTPVIAQFTDAQVWQTGS